MSKALALTVLAGMVVLGACGTSTAAQSNTGPKITAGTTTGTAKPAAASASPTSGIPHAEDVKVSGCGNTGALGGPAATVTITNHSSKTSNYDATISFTSADGKTQYGTADVFVNNLLPGQTAAPQTADSTSSTAAPAGFTCQLAQLDRYAS